MRRHEIFLLWWQINSVVSDYTFVCWWEFYFMSVIKRTRDLLNIRSMFFNGFGASVRFDRSRGQMVMTSLAGIIPFRRTVFALEDIAGAQVRKVERNGGRVTYGIVLRRRRSSADLNFACTSREDAMAVMREIASFLEISPDEPASVAAERTVVSPQAEKA